MKAILRSTALVISLVLFINSGLAYADFLNPALLLSNSSVDITRNTKSEVEAKNAGNHNNARGSVNGNSGSLIHVVLLLLLFQFYFLPFAGAQQMNESQDTEWLYIHAIKGATFEKRQDSLEKIFNLKSGGKRRGLIIRIIANTEYSNTRRQCFDHLMMNKDVPGLLALINTLKSRSENPQAGHIQKQALLAIGNIVLHSSYAGQMPNNEQVRLYKSRILYLIYNCPLKVTRWRMLYKVFNSNNDLLDLYIVFSENNTDPMNIEYARIIKSKLMAHLLIKEIKQELGLIKPVPLFKQKAQEARYTKLIVVLRALENRKIIPDPVLEDLISDIYIRAQDVFKKTVWARRKKYKSLSGSLKKDFQFNRIYSERDRILLNADDIEQKKIIKRTVRTNDVFYMLYLLNNKKFQALAYKCLIETNDIMLYLNIYILAKDTSLKTRLLDLILHNRRFFENLRSLNRADFEVIQRFSLEVFSCLNNDADREFFIRLYLKIVFFRFDKIARPSAFNRRIWEKIYSQRLDVDLTLDMLELNKWYALNKKDKAKEIMGLDNAINRINEGEEAYPISKKIKKQVENTKREETSQDQGHETEDIVFFILCGLGFFGLLIMLKLIGSWSAKHDIDDIKVKKSLVKSILDGIKMLNLFKKISPDGRMFAEQVKQSFWGLIWVYTIMGMIFFATTMSVFILYSSNLSDSNSRLLVYMAAGLLFLRIVINSASKIQNMHVFNVLGKEAPVYLNSLIKTMRQQHKQAYGLEKIRPVNVTVNMALWIGALCGMWGIILQLLSTCCAFAYIHEEFSDFNNAILAVTLGSALLFLFFIRWCVFRKGGLAANISLYEKKLDEYFGAVGRAGVSGVHVDYSKERKRILGTIERKLLYQSLATESFLQILIMAAMFWAGYLYDMLLPFITLGFSLEALTQAIHLAQQHGRTVPVMDRILTALKQLENSYVKNAEMPFDMSNNTGIFQIQLNGLTLVGHDADRNIPVLTQQDYIFKKSHAYCVAADSKHGKTFLMNALKGIAPIESGEIIFIYDESGRTRIFKQDSALKRPNRSIAYVEFELEACSASIEEYIYDHVGRMAADGKIEKSREEFYVNLYKELFEFYAEKIMMDFPGGYEGYMYSVGFDEFSSAGQRKLLFLAHKLALTQRQYKGINLYSDISVLLFDEPLAKVNSTKTQRAVCGVFSEFARDNNMIIIFSSGKSMPLSSLPNLRNLRIEEQLLADITKSVSENIYFDLSFQRGGVSACA